MANTPQIKPHVFHGIYSTIKEDFPSCDMRYENFPLGAIRAIRGVSETCTTLSYEEFQTEDEAFNAYKKLQESEDILSKGGSLCKNYFTIEKKDLHKFKEYFHGMIKSINLKSEINYSINGSSEELTTGPCQTYDKDCNPQGEAPECHCPPCPDCEGNINPPGPYYCNHNYNCNARASIDIDTSKIFIDSNLQNRFRGNFMSRFINFSKYEGAFLDIFTDPSQNSNRIYDNNWQFDIQNFKIFFGNGSENRFPQNSTIINDPIIRSPTYGGNEYRINNTAPFFAIDVSMSSDYNQNYGEQIDFTSNNMGTYSLSAGVNENTRTSLFYTASIAGTSLYYVKSLEKYLCFIELNFSFNDGTSFGRILREGGAHQGLPASNTQLGRFYSTWDELSLYNCNTTEEFSPQPSWVPSWTKKLINISIVGQDVQIEVWTPSAKSFEFTQTRDTATYPCGSVANQSCTTYSISKRYTFSDPVIEIKGWQKEDFNKDVVFPPKVV